MPDRFLLLCCGLMFLGIALGTRGFGLIPKAPRGERILRHYARARKRGLSAADATDELRMFEALERVRETASKTIVRSPETGHDAVSWAIEAEAERLTPRCRLKFIGRAHSLSDADILTPEARELSTRVAVTKAASAASWGSPQRAPERR